MTLLKHQMIRNKILGVLIQDARIQANKSTETCANNVGITREVFEAFEYGDRAPSLPELEMIAKYLGIPFEHFLGRSLITDAGDKVNKGDRQTLLQVRHRKVGTLIRKRRMEIGLSQTEAANQVGISEAELEEFELGEKPLSIFQLETLCGVLGFTIDFLLEKPETSILLPPHQRVPVGFASLPADLQDFVLKPINKPFLEVAYRLSELPVEKLRSVGEGILEITF